MSEITPDIPIEVFDANVQRLSEELLEAERTLDRLQRELNWWASGRSLFEEHIKAVSQQTNGSKPKGTVTVEAFNPRSPMATGGHKPTLRKAIITVMENSDRKNWGTEDLFSALKERGWFPNGKTAEHATRKMLARMAREDEIVRADRGVYALLPKQEALSAEV